MTFDIFHFKRRFCYHFISSNPQLCIHIEGYFFIILFIYLFYLILFYKLFILNTCRILSCGPAISVHGPYILFYFEDSHWISCFTKVKHLLCPFNPILLEQTCSYFANPSSLSFSSALLVLSFNQVMTEGFDWDDWWRWMYGERQERPPEPTHPHLSSLSFPLTH